MKGNDGKIVVEEDKLMKFGEHIMMGYKMRSLLGTERV